MGGMRKLVALLLLFLMSFQTSWAAIAGYCQHEQGAAVAHVGHHEHKHKAGHAPLAGKSAHGILAGDSVSAASTSGGDPDCSVCHAGFLPALMIEPALSVHVLTVSGLAEPSESHPPTAPLDLPERPNWS